MNNCSECNNPLSIGYAESSGHKPECSQATLKDKENKNMENLKCSNNAEVLVSWGGKIMKGCKSHGYMMQRIGSVIGHVVEIKSLPTFSELRCLFAKCEFQDDLNQLLS